jgi:lipopolysaccharide transport system permease protein
MHFLWNNRKLIKRLIVREVEAKYKSTVLGLLWLFITPLFMLSIYAFVFGSILQAKWPNSSNSEFEFAIILYCGLIIFTLFSDFLNRAPGLILVNVNYVKKVIFPIEILPFVAIGSSLFQAMISLAILLSFCFFYYGTLSWTIIFIPLILIPFLILLAGLGLLLSALGVFIRDIAQMVGVLITGLMFMSPLFFPLSAMPEAIRPFIYLNPMTLIIQQMREVSIWGNTPNWLGLFIYLLVSLVVLVLGYQFFLKTRKGFADVL